MTQLANRLLGFFVPDVKAGACIPQFVCTACIRGRQLLSNCNGACVINRACRPR